MSEKKTTLKQSSGIASKEYSYRLAKLLRSGSRELERQLNIKKTMRQRWGGKL